MSLIRTAPPKAARRGRWRRVGLVARWLAVGVLAAVTALRLFGWEGAAWVLVALVAYTPYLVAAGLGLVALLLVRRAWRPLLVAAACTLTLAALTAPRLLPQGQPAAAGPTLRVMAVNLYRGEGAVATVPDLARRHEVDVLVLIELTPRAAQGFAAAGVGDPLRHQHLRTGPTVVGTGIYSRFPVTPAPDLEPVARFAMPAVRMAVPGAAPVEVVAVHPTPPVAGVAQQWRCELRALPAATPTGPVRLLAGDFNATLDHAPLRELIATGYTDAADAVGAGLTGTWRPRTGLASLVPPVQIDRVLVDRRAAVRSFAAYPVPGSDHHAVLAEVTLPAG